ncbi:MAG: molecular chaperone TorD family protein [Chloroflexi bacterium]|nr:molecular chaperone TorD family protein [Chloroflexota bacterium]MBI2980181.1 molecular chaperone TorD family protein [Chloroflexota bacterium]
MNESLGKLAARADVYGLLSQAYYTPEISFLKGDFLATLLRALGSLEVDSFAGEVKNLEGYLQALSKSEELSLEYTRLFRGPVKAKAYPYESMYIEGGMMGTSTLDVLRRYGEAGVAIEEGFKDLPDHISAELEFMHYLCRRELDALQRGADDEARRFRDRQQSFLREHLNKWVPRFTSLIQQYAAMPYYLTIAEITREFIKGEATSNSPG